MTIQRYGLIVDGYEDEPVDPRIDTLDEGEYVKYSDHAAEVAAAVAREREELIETLRKTREIFSDGPISHTCDAIISHIKMRPTPGAAKEV